MSCLCGKNNSELGGLYETSNETSNTANELSRLATTTQEKGQKVVKCALELKDTFGEFKNGGLHPKQFLTLLNILDEGKLKNAVGLTAEMDDLTTKCVATSKKMAEQTSRSAASLPENYKGFKVKGSDRETVLSEDEEREFLDLEKEVTDLEECTASVKEMNILSAATKGSTAFEGIVSKGGVLGTTLTRIKDLCAAISRAADGIMAETCCTQVQAGVDSIKAMLRCMKLSNLISKFVETVRRLVQAAQGLIKLIFEKMKHLVEEYGAAKKIQQWATRLNPLKNSPGGRTYQNMIESETPQANTTSATSISPSNAEGESRTGVICCM